MFWFFLHTTAVTRRWDRYRNKSQHRKLTLENKILLPLQQRFKPATFRPGVRRGCNHWNTTAPRKAHLAQNSGVSCRENKKTMNDPVVSVRQWFSAVLSTQRERQRQRQAGRQADRDRVQWFSLFLRDADRQSAVVFQRDRQTDRQTDSFKTDTQTDRERERERHTHTHTHTH